jgi:uncharacterized membrane protein YfbV (UPF0208 family)
MTHPNNKKFIENLEALAAQHGCTVSEKGNGHYHVQGQHLVNYWPFSKKQSAHVANSKDSLSSCGIEDVVRLACGLTPEAWGQVLNGTSMAAVMTAPPAVTVDDMEDDWTGTREIKDAKGRVIEVAYRAPDFHLKKSHIALSQTNEQRIAAGAGAKPW